MYQIIILKGLYDTAKSTTYETCEQCMYDTKLECNVQNLQSNNKIKEYINDNIYLGYPSSSMIKLQHSHRVAGVTKEYIIASNVDTFFINCIIPTRVG